MGLLSFFSRQRITTAIAIYAIVIATWGVKWYFAGWGEAVAAGWKTPLGMAVEDKVPQGVLVPLSLLLYVLVAAVMQSIFSRVHLGQSKNYLMHLFVPLLSTMSIYGGAFGSVAAAFGTLAGLHVVILLLSKEQRTYSDTLFRACFLIGLLTLVYYPTAVLLLVVLVAMIYQNVVTVNRLTISLIAFILPSCFAAAIALLLGANPDSYIGVGRLVHFIKESWFMSGWGVNMPLVAWGVLLLLLLMLSVGRRNRQSRNILAVYSDSLLRWGAMFSLFPFVMLPSSSAIPVMIAPAVGSGYVYYLTGRGSERAKKWTFAAVVPILILGNLWVAF